MTLSRLQQQIEANTSPGPLYVNDSPGVHVPMPARVRIIAFYLPQYHPIPENDAWWGKGFTEWANVTRSIPRFVGHFQPRLPADLGFYDLRNVDTLSQQVELASRYGIGGFCFHHYWFNGRRLLYRPLELFLANSNLNMPFCVNWANENWTRRWDGLDDDILLAQAHSPEDDIAFARSLYPMVRDPRYIHVDGRPLILVYRPGVLPEPVATMRRWRTEFARAGLGNPYLVMAQGFGDHDPRHHGMDAAVEFPPHKVGVTPDITGRLELIDTRFSGTVQDYGEVARRSASLPRPDYTLFRGVVPSWDNDARKPGRGFTMAYSTPALYGTWLRSACNAALEEARHPDERIVFVNAWNEWAEGAYLEPDRHFGHAYLAETARTLTLLGDEEAKQGGQSDVPRIALISHDAHLHGAQLIALAIARTLVVDHGVALTVLLGGSGELAAQFEAVAPTELIPGDFGDLDAWRTAARRLVGAGVTAVISNSLVSAKALEPLLSAGLRVVQLVHELPSLIRQYGLEPAARSAALSAHAIVFPSAYIRDCFLQIADSIQGRSVVRHQGIYMLRLAEQERLRRRDETRQKLGIPLESKVVLGVGYGDVRKGLDLWPLLTARIAADCPGAVLVWVGRIDPVLHRWLDHDLRVKGIKSQLILTGPIVDMAGVYAAADAFALTSREDPFPSVVIEAMASGLPTVVFDDSGGIVELVREAGGVVVPYLDVEAMASALSHLLLDREAAERMGTALRQRIGKDFDYQQYGADLLEIAAPRQPTVTAIVPNYNYARHLRQRIESIWWQKFRVSELIVLDDASTDGSESLIHELELESPMPVRIFKNAVNSGSVVRQWALGVELGTSDLIWIAEADDFASPEFLQAVVQAFVDPNVVLSYSDSRMVDENGCELAPDYHGYVADIDPARWKKDFRANGLQEIAFSLSVKNTIPNVSAVVFRRSALTRVISETLEELATYRNVADWLCYLRLLTRGSLAFTARALNSHRRHVQSVTLATSDRRHFEEIIEMQDIAASLAPVSVDTRRAALEYRRRVADQFGISSEDIP